MEFGPDKVTVSEADPSLRDRVVRILTDAGYQVSAEPAATLKTVLDFMPDVIVMGASPPQLNCCDLLADVKGSEQARHIRVIMMAAGGSAERARGLELGANDVLSLPLEDRELLARVRAQLRDDRQSHQQAHRIPPLHQGMHSLRLGIVVLAALAPVATGIITFLLQKQNARVFAALAKLQTGVASQRELTGLAREARTETEQNATSSTQAQRQTLSPPAPPCPSCFMPQAVEKYPSVAPAGTATITTSKASKRR